MTSLRGSQKSRQLVSQVVVAIVADCGCCICCCVSCLLTIGVGQHDTQNERAASSRSSHTAYNGAIFQKIKLYRSVYKVV